MEKSVRRRLESLSRHLSLRHTQIPSTHVLIPNDLKALHLELSKSDPVVIGGMVLDIHAKPVTSPSPGTTTPGKIQHIRGGVARNIAECMSKLGNKPFLISIVGLDMPGNMLLDHWESAGLSTEVAANSGVRVWFEPVSVAKSKRVVSIAQNVTFTSPNEDELIAMANALSLDEEFLPVQKLDNNGDRHPIESLYEMLQPAIEVLLKRGIKIVVLTLGSDGVLLCCREWGSFIKETVKNTKSSSLGRQLYELVSSNCPSNKFLQYPEFKWRSLCPYVLHFPALPASVVSLTGAGDCLVGGIISSFCSGLDFMQSVAVGVAIAKTAVETGSNVLSEYCLTTVSDDARRVLSAAKFLFDQQI